MSGLVEYRGKALRRDKSTTQLRIIITKVLPDPNHRLPLTKRSQLEGRFQTKTRKNVEIFYLFTFFLVILRQSRHSHIFPFFVLKTVPLILLMLEMESWILLMGQIS